jgi:hypothetical protein
MRSATLEMQEALFRSAGSGQAAQQQQQPNGSVHRTVDCKKFDHPEFQFQVSDCAIAA